VGPVDPGFLGIRRLNNAEYDNTVRDLLGVKSTPAATFISDEKALGFDTIASALGMTPAQYEQYFNAAEAVVTAAFADPALRGRILTCAPASGGDGACLRAIVQAFGLRAFRRPLTPAEVDRLAEAADEASAAGEDFSGQVRHVVTTMLSSVPFLYRLEIDPRPEGAPARRLDGYELASRLSYTLWSTMPDEALFAAAAKGTLGTDAGLAAELDRMLDHPRAAAYVKSFAGQWLGLRALESHQVEAAVFKDWDEPLRASIINEGSLYFRAFLDGAGRSVNDFFTARMSFVDGRLARHYGLPASTAGAEAKRIENAGPDRVGFLGTAAFLTTTSFSYRTSPTKRGVWILDNLLCTHVPDPPPDIPELDKPGGTPSGNATQNVRDRLAQHREDPSCAGCHNLFDPIGLGLERFDAIGRTRDKYPNGDVIDATGKLPDGTTFDGLPALSTILAKDPRFVDCLSEKLFVHAHGRAIGKGDEAALAQLREGWRKDGLNLRGLVKRVILGETFRSRRGEGAL
jgi:hypothetical protein